MKTISLEIESSRYDPTAHWVPGGEYYATTCTLLVADGFDESQYDDEQLLEMAEDESNGNVRYAPMSGDVVRHHVFCECDECVGEVQL